MADYGVSANRLELLQIADAVAREEWSVKPPHVDPDGYFFSVDCRCGPWQRTHGIQRGRGSSRRQPVSRPCGQLCPFKPASPRW